MGPYLELRRWLIDSPPVERRVSMWIAIVAFGLLVVALAPVGREETASLSASLPGTTATGQPTSPGGSSGAPVMTTGESMSIPGSSAANGVTSIGGTRGTPGATELGTASPSQPPEPLIASDNGVTPESVTIGFAMLDLSGARQLGIGAAAGLRPDIEQAIDAFVDWANGQGGIHGRAIIADKKFVDIINVQDQRTKCLQFTQSDRVFAVIDSITYNSPVSRACITQENETPLISDVPGSAAEVAQSAPYNISTTLDYNQDMRNTVLAARDLGYFDAANGFRRLGVLSDSCDRSVIDDPSIGLGAWLQHVGISDWSEFVADCANASQATNSASQALLQFRQAGVTHVIFVTDLAVRLAFLSGAQSTGYRPQYFAPEIQGQASDGGTRDHNPDQWNGTLGVTVTYQGVLAAGQPLPPAVQTCSQILTDHGLEPIANFQRDVEVLLMCDHIRLLIETARHAPRNLVRADLGGALGSVGVFEGAYVSRSVFTPGVYAGGGGLVSTLEWRRDCRCQVQVAGFRDAPTS